MSQNQTNPLRTVAAGENGELQLNIYGLMGSDGRLTWSRGTASLNINGGIRVGSNGTPSDTTFSGAEDLNLLHIDASNDEVGIGTADPLAKLDVHGSAVFNSGSEDADFQVKSMNHPDAILVDAGADTVTLGVPSTYIGSLTSAGAVYISDGSGNYIGIDAPVVTSNWAITLPDSQPAEEGQHLESVDANGNTRWASNYWNPITPAQFTSNQNDVPLTAGKEVMRASSDGNYNVTGFANGVDGRFFHFINVGSNVLNLKHEDAGSDAANRIITCDGADLSLTQSGSALLWYDGATQRWRVLSYQLGGGAP